MSCCCQTKSASALPPVGLLHWVQRWFLLLCMVGGAETGFCQSFDIVPGQAPNAGDQSSRHRQSFGLSQVADSRFDSSDCGDLWTDVVPQSEQLFSEQPIERFKKQAIQSVGLSAGTLMATGHSDLNSSFLDASVGLGIPLGDFGRILGVTPNFRVDFLDAAASLDVPEELFETGVSFFYRDEINERFSVMAIVRPSIRSDFTTSDNALRIFGLGLLAWDYIPDKLALSFGAVALGRADLPVLPAVGLSWTPRRTTRLDLRFPESRLSQRLFRDGNQSETWSYVSLGLGGNTWAITRDSGLHDEMSLRDIRVVVGVDHLVQGGGGWFAECGYAFARRIEYEATDSEVPLSDGVLLQAGWRY